VIGVVVLLGAALVVGVCRGGPTPRSWWRRRSGRVRALVVSVALVGALALVGAPASAQAFDCKAPPDPDRPGTGLVGSLDPAPIGVGTPGSAYDEVGYAGQVWWTYDLGCGPGGARDPSAATDTWLGNQVFNVAKVIVGGVNWAHHLIARGSGLLAPLDGVITTGTRAMYEAVFTTWAGVALAVLAAVLLLLAMRGDLSRQTRRAGVAVLALAIAAAAYAAPVQWSRLLDGVLLDGVTAMQQGFLAPVGGSEASALPTVLTDQIVYTTWLRGEFGSADAPQARDLGRELLRAQTFSKGEVATGQDGQAQADAKRARFSEIAGQVGDRYSYLQGRSGSRVGAGVLALIQAGAIALFQLMSKLLVLVSMLVIRLMVMTAPALAVVALLKPEVLGSMLRIGGTALVNTLLVGALAGLHSLLVVALFRPGSGVDTWLALLVTGVVTIVLWAVARPFRRLSAMVTLTRDQLGGLLPAASGGGVFGRTLARLRGSDPSPSSSLRGLRPEESPAPGRAAGSRQLEAGASDTAVVSRPAPARALTAEADRALYRRTTGGGPGGSGGGLRPVRAEIVDGAPVYRIYRPGPARPVAASVSPSGSGSGFGSGSGRGSGRPRADPD